MSNTVSLVTGGCGFIGQHLVRLLAARGDDVRVLDQRQSRHLPAEIEFIQGSILDQECLGRAFRGVDRVFHLAANPRLWARDKAEFDQVNHVGTKMVMAGAEQAGVSRIVYTSTESILCPPGHRRSNLTSETVAVSLTDLPGPYCRSKFLAEQAALEAGRRGLPVVIVNPTLPVGPGDWGLTPPTQMLLLFLNGQTPAYLDGPLNFVDVRDAALGHILAAEKGRIGERYILGGRNLKMSQLLDLLHDMTGLSMPRVRVPYGAALVFAAVSEFLADHVTHRPPQAPIAGVRLMRRSMAFDSSKAQTELGMPQTPLPVSLADAIEWFKEQGYLEREGAAAPLGNAAQSARRYRATRLSNKYSGAPNPPATTSGTSQSSHATGPTK